METKQGMMVVEKQKASFVYDVHMNFRQMPLTHGVNGLVIYYVKLANAVPLCFNIIDKL